MLCRSGGEAAEPGACSVVRDFLKYITPNAGERNSERQRKARGKGENIISKNLFTSFAIRFVNSSILKAS